MKLKEYENIIAETAIYPKEITQSFGLAYCMLGLIEEFQELSDTRTKTEAQKEAGDVIWYITAMATEVNTSISELWLELATEKYEPFDTSSTKDILCRLSGKVKKHYRDGKDYSAEIKTSLKQVLVHMKKMLDTQNIDFSEVLQTNYDKLIKRRETNTLHGEGDNREEK